ncbi:hypothetical protein JEQ12_008654 [Ovis aries]|uniref:Uncharacterized protein n=1 Tax=Ovis aries TaxID=9940 RepID=A0A836ALN0_SHEEP|nr:hypothetical protein JEQ12_008654 [Ovis aries]
MSALGSVGTDPPADPVVYLHETVLRPSSCGSLPTSSPSLQAASATHTCIHVIWEREDMLGRSLGFQQLRLELKGAAPPTVTDSTLMGPLHGSELLPCFVRLFSLNLIHINSEEHLYWVEGVICEEDRITDFDAKQMPKSSKVNLNQMFSQLPLT